MTTVTVFRDPGELADRIEKDPENNLKFEVRKLTPGKDYQGTRFFETKVKKTEDNSWHSLIVKAVDLIAVFGASERKRDDKKEGEDNKKEENTKRFDMSFIVANTGDYGRLVRVLNKEYLKWAEKTMNGEIEGFKVKPGTNVNKMISDTYSFDHLDMNKQGKPKDHPTLNVKIDFSKYPATHPKSFLRNRTKTEIYDFRTKYIDDKNRVQYKLAEIEGKPVDETNVTHFITRDSRIVEARVHLDSGSKSSFGFAITQLSGKLIIDPSAEGGFDDEAEEASAEEIEAFKKQQSEKTEEESKDIDDFVDEV